MSIPAEHPLLQASDPSIRNWRQRYYDPDQLRESDSTLHVVMECLDELVSDSEVGRSYLSDRGEIWQHYERGFVEALGEEPEEAVLTRVAITNTIFKPRGIVRENWQASLRYAEPEGAPLYWKNYSVRLYAGSVASMEIGESLDGLGAALMHDDPAFLRAVRWKDATEHDATLLFDELQRLRAIQAESSWTEQPTSFPG